VCVADDEVDVGAIRVQRIITRKVKFSARLPPPIYRANDLWMERAAVSRLKPDLARDGLDIHPFPVENTQAGCRVRMNFHEWFAHIVTQTWDVAMLRINKLQYSERR
jgi:hypothetical protein